MGEGEVGQEGLWKNVELVKCACGEEVGLWSEMSGGEKVGFVWLGEKVGLVKCVCWVGG